MPARAAAVAAIVATGLLGGCTAGVPSAGVGSVAATTTVPLDPAISEIVEGAGMTDLGRRIFLSASPRVEDAQTLARSCAPLALGGDGQGIHTFGCLIDGDIHLRWFGHPEVHDLVYVVAAHELLHVAYNGLEPAERVVLDRLLNAARVGNTVLEERLEVYTAAAEDTPSEVHSILGTEFADLGPDLETHYSRYFDRARVLDAFRRTIGEREEEIRALKAAIAGTEAALDTMRVELDRLRAIGDLDGYNAEVARYNALVDQHNASVARVNALVEEDNRLTS